LRGHVDDDFGPDAFNCPPHHAKVADVPDLMIDIPCDPGGNEQIRFADWLER
jgi:hypothetical protein